MHFVIPILSTLTYGERITYFALTTRTPYDDTIEEDYRYIQLFVDVYPLGIKKGARNRNLEIVVVVI